MDEMGDALRLTRTPGGRFWVLSGCIELSTVLYYSSLSWSLTYRVGEEKVNKNEENRGLGGPRSQRNKTSLIFQVETAYR